MKSNDDLGYGNGLAIGGIATACLILFVILVIFLSYFTVAAGHVAVIKRFGAVQEGYYMPGLHFKFPFIESVEHVDVRMSTVSAKAGAASSDLQVVTVEIAVPYYLEPAMVPAMINGLGSREKFETAVLASAIQESVKAVTANYTAEGLITNRASAKTKVVELITRFVDDTLDRKGMKNTAQLANVAIRDFDFDPGFNKSIERKVQMQQDALRAEIEKVKRVTDAEAKFAEAKLAADGIAYAALTEGTARARSIDLEGEALRKNPEIVRLRTIERWDGILPRITGGQMPLLTLDSNEVIGQPGAPRAAANR